MVVRVSVKSGRGYNFQTKAQRNRDLKIRKAGKNPRRLLRSSPTFTQNPSKQIGLFVFKPFVEWEPEKVSELH